MTSSSDPEAEKAKERREIFEQQQTALKDGAIIGNAARAERIRLDNEARANLKRFEAESEKTQLYFMLIILVVTISAGTILMGVSLALPITFIVSNPNASPQVLQQINEAPKNVLPFATALVGFAGGLVTAIYGKSAYARSSQSPPSVVA